MTFGIEYTGLRETAAALKKAGVADDAVKDAMQGAGQIIQREALKYAPVRTGKLAGTIKVNRSKSLVKITAGNNTTVKYAWFFHAPSGRTTGYMGLGPPQTEWIFRVPAHRRRGSDVRAYTARRRLVDRPFLFKAWTQKREEFLEAYVSAIAGLFRGGTHG